MSDKPSFFRRKSTYLVGIPVLILLAVVGGPFVYINFIRDDAPERLSLDDVTTSSTARGDDAATPATVDGAWTIADDSLVGYRVDEILFGQTAEAVGRTGAVEGSLTIAGTTVTDASFTVDMTTVQSDESNRDRQFQGRIMDTAQFPTAEFRLTEPLELDEIPDDGREVTVDATGDLTLRGTTKSVTFPVRATRTGDRIAINATIPINFPEWGIPNPSGGPASVGDDGELEVLLVLNRA
jgi:polyisoprenoid-binding protein YceI